MSETWNLDITEDQFDAQVLQRSRSVPVLVDFWAPWCGPCKTLSPLLGRLVAEYQGRFVLAKVNVDDYPRLAQDFAVRSIPSVKAFVDGRLVDEFTGVLPEGALRDFIDRLMPPPAEVRRREAVAAHAAGDAERALTLLAEAWDLPGRGDAVLADRIGILLELGRLDEAREAAALLSPVAHQDAHIGKLLAELRFAGGGAARPRAELEQAVAADPGDLVAREALARVLVAAGEYEAALGQLLEIVRRDRRFGDDVGRRTMLAVFDLLDGRGELVSRYRRLLAAALH